MDEEILNEIYEMIIDGCRISVIKSKIGKTHNIKPNDINLYIAEAKSRILKNREELEELDLHIQLERLRYIYDLAKESNNLKIMIQAQSEIDKIMGLQKQDIKANVDTDFTINFQ